LLSYWESETFLNYDVIIVGAGITGLSATISILEKQPYLNILVLEKSLFPDGASTKNAGFACFGSLTELLDDIQQMGEEASLDLVKQRWKGLQKLRSRFSDKAIGYEGLGGYELIHEGQIRVLNQVEKVNQLLTPIFNIPVFEDVSDRIDEMGFNSQTYSGLVFNAFEGQIHTGKTIDSLWKLATKLGAKILTGADVESII
jgi:glycine/D-amino acid oxidase-like deaminating enzyme